MIGLLWEVGSTRRHSLPPGWTGLEGHRDERWEWKLLDDQDAVTGLLGSAVGDPGGHGVSKASLDLNVAGETRGKGQLDWSGAPGQQPDWVNVRLQAWYHAEFPDGSRLAMPWGVFLPATDGGGTFEDGLVRVSLDLYDKTLILRDDQIESTFALPAGTAVVPAVRDLVEGAGAGRHVIEDSAETLRTPIFWEVGTSKLRIVNDLLDAIDYFGIWADGYGVLRSSRRVPPSGRPHEWTFTGGPRAVRRPGVVWTKDWFHTPNKITVVSTSDGETDALRAVATNTDPDDPLSYRAPDAPANHKGRRRWVSETVDGVEATSQEVLQAHADRLLASARQTASKVQLRHPVLPLTINGRVTVASPGGDVTGVVQAMHIECATGAACSTTIQEVRT